MEGKKRNEKALKFPVPLPKHSLKTGESRIVIRFYTEYREYFMCGVWSALWCGSVAGVHEGFKMSDLPVAPQVCACHVDLSHMRC